MFILTFIRKLYKALSLDASPSAVAFAASFGVLAGCVPLTSGVAIFMMLLIVVFRVQISTALFTWALARLACMGGLAVLFEGAGERLLEAEGLRSFWTWFLNLPVVAWFDLHRYAILGGAVVGFLLGALLFLPVRMLVIAYRRSIHERVSRNRFFRWLTNFWLVRALRFVLVGAGR